MDTEQSPTEPKSVKMTKRVPGEWEPKAAVWVSHPHKAATWPNCLTQAQAQHAAFVDAMRQVVEVKDIKEVGLEGNDSWLRDSGPIFTIEQVNLNGSIREQLVVSDFRFNNWGEKYPNWDKDDALPSKIAQWLGIPNRRYELSMEGGGICSNGNDAVLLTDPCFINDNRNPGLDRAAIEQQLDEALGFKRCIWLADGLSGDDTDGHIDNVARFVSENKVIVSVAPPGDIDHEITRENVSKLKGYGFDVVELPVPEPIHYVFPAGAEGNTHPESLENNERLPANYANFLMCNGVVFVPIFGQPEADQNALDIIAAATGDQAIGVRAEYLLVGGGGPHCLTCDQPTPPAFASDS